MTYLIFAVSIVCLLFWPAVAALMKVTGLAGDWEQAHWWGAAACGSLWLVTVVDLVRRRVYGLPLEPTVDDE